MTSHPEPNRLIPQVETEGGDAGWAVVSDSETGNQATGEPIRSLVTLRLLVRERMKVYGAPLPEGYQLPPGITLEDLLKPPTRPEPI